MGAWIETSGTTVPTGAWSVAPVWVRGLKQSETEEVRIRHEVAPVWVRGLKRIRHEPPVAAAGRTRMGAWIETTLD